VKDGLNWKTPYFYKGDTDVCWDSIPIVAFRCNNDEIPLLKSVKALQDGLNVLMSNFQNSMEEDVRNTILVLKNYDGENLGEFRHNLSTYGAVKVRSVDGAQGGVETLSIQVNSENYKTVIELFKKAIIENGRGYDAKDDIDLDANAVECCFQASMEKLAEFVLYHLHNTGDGDFFDEDYEIIFNRDILISESEAIDNCIKSLSVLSEETVIAQHPWVDDVRKEIERKKKENIRNSEEDVNDEGKIDGAGA
jgi:hypothetical protein